MGGRENKKVKDEKNVYKICNKSYYLSNLILYTLPFLHIILFILTATVFKIGKKIIYFYKD